MLSTNDKINLLLKKAAEIGSIVDYNGMMDYIRHETEGRTDEEIYNSPAPFVSKMDSESKREAETSLVSEYLLRKFSLMDEIGGYTFETLESWADMFWKWRYGKLVYSFDKGLEDVLIEQADDYRDAGLPVEVLNHLPAPAVLILCGRDDVLDKIEEKSGVPMDRRVPKGLFKLVGFMVTTDHAYRCRTYGTNLMIHYILYNNEEKKLTQTSSYLSLSDTDDLKIETAVEKQAEYLSRWSISALKYPPEEMKMLERRNAAMAEYAMQYILYLCAQNSEVRQNPENVKTFRKPEKKEFVKDKYREVKLIDAGYITGPRIREFFASKKSVPQSYASGGTGAKKSPHARRAHWSHYWYGPRDSEKRDCKLRWINTIFVHADEEAESDAVNIRVREK